MVLWNFFPKIPSFWYRPPSLIVVVIIVNVFVLVVIIVVFIAIIITIIAEEEVQTSIWRDPGARRKEDTRDDLEDPNLFFKRPS